MKINQSVIIKSNNKGLILVLDKDVDFPVLIEDVCKKFADARDFFGDAQLTLTIEGRDMTPEEIMVVVEAIELNSDIHIRLICRNDVLFDARMLKLHDRFYFEDFFTNAKIIPGSVTRKSVETSDSSIVILGDVLRGGRVEAVGNVLVMGEVLGSVLAGTGGDKRCYVAGNYFDAEEITIAGIGGPMRKKKRFFSNFGRTTERPQAVFLWEDSLLSEPLEKGAVKQLFYA